MNPRNLIYIISILIGIIFLYFETLANTIKNWFTYESSHGLLILAVSFYLIWIKREKLRQLPIKHNLPLGTVFTGFGCFMLLSGKLSSTLLLQQISLIFTVLGVIWLCLGFGYFRALLVPVGYLIFMFGFFEEVFGNISIYLQYITAWIASNLLTLTGWPIFLSSRFIELPHITLEVAKACNGINHIIALVALAVLLAFMTQKTSARKGGLILIAFLIGILANGLRVALIGIWTYYNKGGSLHGPFDTLYVSFIFFFGMILIIFISLFSKEKKSKRSSFIPNTSQVTEEVSLLPASNLQPQSQFYLPAHPLHFNPFIILLVIFTVTFGFIHFYKPRPVYLKSPLKTFPVAIGDFNGEDSNQKDKRFGTFSADEELIRVYRTPTNHNIKLYIGYFTLQGQSQKIVDYRLNWMHDEAETISISLGEERCNLKKSMSLGEKDIENIYFWYYVNGRMITGRHQAKFATIWNGLIKRKTNAAIIVIQSRENEKEVMTFIQYLIPIIHNHL